MATESKVIDSIFEADDSLTLIMIAHRISTLDRSDRILLLNNKTINEIDYKEANKVMEALIG